MSEILRTDWAANFSLRTVCCAGFGCVLGAALLATATPARAGDDDTSIETKIMRSVLEGIGLRKDGESTITYEERAPLVIPPSRALPPPERSGAMIANNPAWPKDPDIQRAKEEAALEKTESTLNTAEQVRHDSGRLTPGDLEPGRKPRGPRKSTSADSSAGTSWGYGEKLSPTQLGFKDNLFGMMFGKSKEQEDVAHFTSEPPRAALTDPPAGYQTPSPVQPYGVGKAPPQAPTSQDYMVNHPVGEQ